jgi:hypothetical protein
MIKKHFVFDIACFLLLFKSHLEAEISTIRLFRAHFEVEVSTENDFK